MYGKHCTERISIPQVDDDQEETFHTKKSMMTPANETEVTTAKTAMALSTVFGVTIQLQIDWKNKWQRSKKSYGNIVIS